MGLFDKKKEASACSCSHSRPSSQAAGAHILVLGSGCARCRTLEEITRAALVDLGMDEPVGHITDFAQIAAYGVLSTPALVVDGQVVSCGQVPSRDQVKALIQKSRG